MKKLIAILLVILVAGFVFGDGADPVEFPDTTTLTLKAAVDGKAAHGFHGGGLKNSFSEVFAIDLSEEATNNLGDLEKNVEMELTNIQPVGYYSFATNSNAGFTVSMEVTPMTLIVGSGESSSSLLYVPFVLQFDKGEGSIGVNQTKNIYNATGLPGVDPPDANDEIVLIPSSAVSPSQLNWASYSVAVQFYGDSNEAYGLPQGNYISTITASITAE